MDALPFRQSDFLKTLFVLLDERYFCDETVYFIQDEIIEDNFQAFQAALDSYIDARIAEALHKRDHPD